MSIIVRRCWRSAVDEITPDIVARIASRIYNETQSVPTPPLVQVDSVPAASVVANPAHAPAAARTVPMPSTGRASPSFPSAWPSLASTAAKPELASKSLSPSQSSDLTGLGDASSLPWREDKPAVQSNEGLAAFVRGVRQVGVSKPDAPAPDPTWRNRRPFFATPSLATGGRPFDVASIRKEFPILRQHVNGRPLAWFDNAATTQKPQCVIDAISRFYENDNSNIHRGAHTLAARATDAYEAARRKVQAFLGAASEKEIVFARGTTEAINLIANTFGRKFLSPGDEIVLSTLEHHANIVPWQLIAKEKGAVIRVIPVNDRGEIILEEYQRLLGPRTKLVAITQASNSLGTILPVGEMTQIAKRYGARVLIDGAQSVAHIPVNVQVLGADFFVFSGHKIFAPTGIGVAYIKEELHDILPPWQGGGNMIRNVTFEETTFSEAPAKFEAGTPNIADAVGLGAALDFVSRLGLSNIAAYEHELLEYATHGLAKVNGLRLIGAAREKVGVLSFVLPHMRTEDVGRQLDQEGIAVRAGHHCSQPSLRRFGVETTVRPSLSLYNTNEEIDRLVEALQRITRRGV
jgi:cysteine desulfurase/selenocysteine lyase